MVHIVHAQNKAQFGTLLKAMHRDRKRIFVDWLKWDVPVVDGAYEVDQFDTDAAIYLIEGDPRCGQHHASVRLLPTTGPHLLADVFPVLCEGPVPKGYDIWELTRFCISPEVTKSEARHLMNLMWTAVVEYAVEHKIAKYTCITHIQFLSQILTAGWDTEPLGLPQKIDGCQIGAILFGMSPAILDEARTRFGYHESVFQGEQHSRAA